MSEHVRISPKAVGPLVRPLAATTGILQRKCSCGGSSPSGGECEERKKSTGALQRKEARVGAPRAQVAPRIVHDVLRSSGRPLSSSVRAFFEPRLSRAGDSLRNVTPPVASDSQLTMTQPGDRLEQEADQFADRLLGDKHDAREASACPRYDLSKIRIHTGHHAADAAAAVKAHAFTVGNHVVFGDGAYDHNSPAGLRLLAHELAHTVQQSPQLARQPDDPGSHQLPPHNPAPHFSPVGSCYGSAICSDLLTPSKLLQQAAANPQNQSKRDARKQACQGSPPPAACAANGHGAAAVETHKLLHSYNPSLPQPDVKLVVDKDLESDFRALTIRCSNFVPPITGATTCITVPEETEKESTQFNNTQDSTIDGKERGLWRERMLEILVHESAHASFRRAVATKTLLANQPPCANQDTLSAMSELTAMVNEFPLRMERIHTSVSLSDEERKQELEEWRDHRIRGKRQSITVSLRTVRCVCACDDADKMIKETVEFATASWTQPQKNELHRELRDLQWASLDLRWPFVAPAIPSIQAVPAQGKPTTGSAITPRPAPSP